jgi:hypothetical protein
LGQNDEDYRSLLIYSFSQKSPEFSILPESHILRTNENSSSLDLTASRTVSAMGVYPGFLVHLSMAESLVL